MKKIWCRSLLLWALLSGFALAQPFPSKPITLIFPFPAGTPTEAVYRMINAEAGKLLGQSIVLENRPGANARLGVNAIRNSPADGHLLAVVNDSILVAQPIADPGFKIEAGKDYVPISVQFEYPLAVYGRPGLPFRDVPGLIAYAKANPGKLNFANSPTTQFPAELMRQAADINVTFIPYKGAEMLTDMVGERVDLTIQGASGLSFISSGKLVAIATTGARRWDPLPDTATLKEGGIQVDYNVWFGIAVAGGTPPAAVTALANAYASAVKNPDVLKAYKTNGYFTPSRGATPRDFSDFIQTQFGVWEPVIRKAGIRIN